MHENWIDFVMTARSANIAIARFAVITIFRMKIWHMFKIKLGSEKSYLV
jgi:hypothetical protein